MLKCEKCNKYYDITNIWKSTRFCSTSCSHSYVSSFVNHGSKKEANCKKCGKQIFISKMHHVIIHYVMNAKRQDEENKRVLLIYIESKLKHL